MQDYKCLCTAAMTCATIVARTFDLYILTAVTPENTSNWGEVVS